MGVILHLHPSWRTGGLKAGIIGRFDPSFLGLPWGTFVYVIGDERSGFSAKYFEG